MKSAALVLLLLLAAVGCRASVEAKGSANASGKGEVADYDKPLKLRQGEGQEASPLAPGHAMLGARHDLNYAGEPQETCSCLAVAVGQPNDPRFSWEAVVPSVDAQTQVVVALSSQSIACAKAKKNSLGASYQGYVRDGDDVIVLIEEAKAGRPLTSGGIVPKPAGQGALYVRPAAKGLPWGKDLTTGAAKCLLSTAAPSASAAPVPDDVFKRPFKTKSLKGDDSELPPESTLETLPTSESAEPAP